MISRLYCAQYTSRAAIRRSHRATGTSPALASVVGLSMMSPEPIHAVADLHNVNNTLHTTVLRELPSKRQGLFKLVDAPSTLATGSTCTVDPMSCSDEAQGIESEAPPQPKRKRQSRLQELQQAREELKAKELKLLQQSEELQQKDQSIAILQQQLDIERVLRALLEKDKEKAEEIAALAMNLCSGAMIPL